MLSLDEERRRLIAEVEQLRAEQNRISREIGLAKAEIDPGIRQDLIDQVGGISAKLKSLGPELARVEDELQSLAARLPNVPEQDVPVVDREAEREGRAATHGRGRTAIQLREHGERGSPYVD